MENGLWTVDFRTSVGSSGTGTIIFENGRVAGGDAGYYYIGSYQIDQDNFTAEAKIQRFNPSSISVFGQLERGDIKISGSIKGALLTGNGQLSQHPEIQFAIRGTKRENF